MKGIWLTEGLYITDVTNISHFCLSGQGNSWIPIVYVKTFVQPIELKNFERAPIEIARKHVKEIVARIEKELSTAETRKVMDGILNE